MARRKRFFDTLVLLPWPVGIAMGVVGYLGIAFGIPAIWSTQPMLAGASSAMPMLGFLFLGICFAAAAFSAFRSFFIRRKFDQQRGIEDIRNLSWRQFESIIGEGFRRRGFTVLENGGGGADGGVDLVLQRDGKKFYVQCKQWKARKIGVKPVRELFGVISARDAEGGFFVASGAYTREARQFANECGIELIDGPALERMVLEARDAEPFMDPTAKKRDVTSRPAVADTPSCPTCGAQMAMRTAKRGANAGKDFWGCSGYPGCRGIREI
jgi:restriction system protein